MNYRDICEANKTLYEAMECLTDKINALYKSDVAHEMVNEIADLRGKKNKIVERININLDAIEKIWNDEDVLIKKILSTKHIDSNNDKKIYPYSETERTVIDQYRWNYDKSAKNIASLTGVGIKLVEQIIEKYINKKQNKQVA